MPATQPADRAARKVSGAYYTPPALVELLAERTVTDLAEHLSSMPEPIRVLDPACGDGRVLDAIGARLRGLGVDAVLVGCDIDARALDRARSLGVRTVHGNALDLEWGDDRFDVVIGNPPYLSQMATTTTRGGSSRHGGGPYADAAAEFLALSVALADPRHGRISLVLPQSILASRDAAPIRDRVGRLADHAWSWWSRDQQWFDASVNVCVVGFRRPATRPVDPLAWTSVVTDRLGVPHLDSGVLDTDGPLGDRAELNANFRDEYYALVPAVGDHPDGPPLVTSGLIDPGCCRWGETPVTFAKRRFERPRVDLSRLEGRFAAWAVRKLVPKVLIANQTRRLEAVADIDGAWLPGVPVITATPLVDDAAAACELVRRIEAVLCSPVAAAFCWHLGAGTGLSATTVRLSPAGIASIPWPAGDLADAVDALELGDLEGCGRAVGGAYGLDGPLLDELLTWWIAGLPARDGAVARR